MILDFLRETKLTQIAADEPQYGNLATVPFVPEATSEIGYFRLHGRNTTNWLKKGLETALRYAYLYTDEELRAFVPAIHQVGGKTKTLYLMFNNCYGSFAIQNANRLMEILGIVRVTEAGNKGLYGEN